MATDQRAGDGAADADAAISEPAPTADAAPREVAPVEPPAPPPFADPVIVLTDAVAAVAVSDVDRDDVADLVVSRSGSRGSIHWLRGRGDARFEAARSSGDTNATARLIAADFNGDGAVDIARTDEYGMVELWVGHGGPYFDRPRAPIASRLIATTAADVDGDGDAELIGIDDALDSTVMVYRVSPANVVMSARSFSLPTTHRLVASDLNGDRRADLVAFWQRYPNRPSIYAGTHEGLFSDPLFSARGAPFGGARGAAVGDVDGDAQPEVLLLATGVPVGGGAQDALCVLRRAAGGMFAFDTANCLPIGTREAVDHLVVGDFDGDGDLDAVGTSTDATHGATAWLNDGRGRFRVTEPLPLPAHTSNLVVADFDRDGADDLLVHSRGAANGVTMLRGVGR